MNNKTPEIMQIEPANSHNGNLTTEQKILKAAECEFFEKGLAGARTTTIAEAAGVTHAMLHYYFRTKGKLFEKVIQDKLRLMGNLMLDSIATSGKSIYENIEQIVSAHYDFIAENPTLPRFVINEIFSDPEKMKFMTDSITFHARSVLSSLQQQIDEAAANNECRHVDAGMLMLDIVSLNIFPFMATPVVNAIFGDKTSSLCESRKQENVETILRKLKL